MKLEALKQLNPEQVKVDICLVQLPQEVMGMEAEVDEMWSYVGCERQSSLAVACN